MVPRELIVALRSAFNDFINPFKYAPYTTEPAVEKTIDHIGRVVQNSLILASALDLGENEESGS